MTDAKIRGQSPVTRQKILRAIEINGPMTAAELTTELGMHNKAVVSAIRYARPAHLHISGYKRYIGISGGRWAAIYALGPGKDAPAPPREDHNARNKRHRIKYKGLINLKKQAKEHGVQSINHWAVTLGMTHVLKEVEA